MKNGGIHAGHRERMRKRFIEHGFEGFSDHEIIEFLLYYCNPRRDVNGLAHNIFDRYGTLANVFDASVEELASIDGMSEVSATLFCMIPKLAKEYDRSKWARHVKLSSAQEFGEYAMSLFKDKVDEELALICLDSNRRVVWGGVIIKGTIDRTESYPRTIVKEALRRNAINVVLVHNHPNGTLSPSAADKKSTHRLVELLDGIGITVLDHIIVSGMRYISMREMGYIV